MGVKGKLHVFWRVGIAALAGLIVNWICWWLMLYRGISQLQSVWWKLNGAIRPYMLHHPLVAATDATTCVILVGIPTVITVAVVYWLLTRQIDTDYSVGETRCRRCNHILRGLSEPRCPECGEMV